MFAEVSGITFINGATVVRDLSTMTIARATGQYHHQPSQFSAGHDRSPGKYAEDHVLINVILNDLLTGGTSPAKSLLKEQPSALKRAAADPDSAGWYWMQH